MSNLFDSHGAPHSGWSQPEPIMSASDVAIPPELQRVSPARWPRLSESEVVRHFTWLSSRNFGIDTGFYPLGSCTMKLNAAAEMMPITWPEFAFLHPFAPADQTKGYKELCDSLSDWLIDITGLNGCSLQPNSGAQGEYTGLLVIRAYHLDNGDTQRNIFLIPSSGSIIGS